MKKSIIILIIIFCFSSISYAMNFDQFKLGLLKSCKIQQRIWGGRIDQVYQKGQLDLAIRIINTGSGKENYLLTIQAITRMKSNNAQSEIAIIDECTYPIDDISPHNTKIIKSIENIKNPRKNLTTVLDKIRQLNSNSVEKYIIVILKTSGFPYMAIDYKVFKL